MHETLPVETSLAGRTILMSGGSRGIGLEILVAAARQGANCVLLAKTSDPDPRIPGTVHTAVAQIEDAGGAAVAVVGDVRSPDDVERAVEAAHRAFGGIDIVINNASALNTQGTASVSPKRFQLMQSVNSGGTFLLTRACLPALRRSGDGQILTLSPPLNLDPGWMGAFPPYMLSKYGMSLLALGWASELRADGIRSNCLWPRTTIATAAVANLLGGDEAVRGARSPAIVADAAMVILADPSRPSGRTFLDEDVLRAAGVGDLSQYGGGAEPDVDLFVGVR